MGSVSCLAELATICTKEDLVVWPSMALIPLVGKKFRRSIAKKNYHNRKICQLFSEVQILEGRNQTLLT